MIKTTGFKSPNYTQTPNDWFASIPEMSDAEMRVTAVLIRETLGYHRDRVTMGLNKIAEAAGLSRNGAKAGAEAAEARGTIRRTNPEAQGSADWTLNVEDDPPAQPAQPEQPTPQSRPNSFALYESNIGPLTPHIADGLKDAEQTYSPEWVEKAILEAAASNIRSLKYILGILAGYKERGSPDVGRSKAPQRTPRSSVNATEAALDRVLG